MIGRAFAGLALAAAIALAARRAGSLSGSGALAAAAVGTAAVASGWSWGAMLLLYFMLSVLLGRLRAAERERRTSAIVVKGGARDAWQVLANGGVFGACALAFAATGITAWGAAALGALAASMADTWATEIGTLARGAPRSILSLREVPAGTSGGVSVPGSLAMLAGAGCAAAAACVLGLAIPPLVVVMGGVGGALADSLLGASLQERRWCPACNAGTERRVHHCGNSTTLAGGLAWLDNDAVNLGATITGAAVAAWLFTVGAP